MATEGTATAGVHDGQKVLVSVASKYGATADIGRAIGEVLAAHGFDVTVLRPREVGSVGGYGAVILGSAVYAGHWLGEAKEFVTRSRAALVGRPVWLFSSGPVGDPASKLAQSMAQDPVDLGPIRAAIHDRGHRIFAGRLVRKNLTFAQRAALRVFRALEGDFRDWAEIRKWAETIAGELARTAPARG